MVRRGWIAAAGALNLAVLVATSEATYELSDTAGPFEVELSAEQPVLFISGEVDAGEAVSSVSFTVELMGANALETPALVRLYEVPPDSSEIPATAVEVGSAELAAGEVYLRIDQELSSEAFGPFSLALQLEGEAALAGELRVTAFTEAGRDEEEDWSLALEGVEVTP